MIMNFAVMKEWPIYLKVILICPLPISIPHMHVDTSGNEYDCDNNSESAIAEGKKIK